MNVKQENDLKCLFIRNLPFDITQQKLEDYFGNIGPIRKVSLIKSKGSKQSDTITKGIAFIRYSLEVDAKTAIEKLNGTLFQKRKLLIEYATKKTSSKQDESLKNDIINVKEKSIIEVDKKQESLEVLVHETESMCKNTNTLENKDTISKKICNDGIKIEKIHDNEHGTQSKKENVKIVETKNNSTIDRDFKIKIENQMDEKLSNESKSCNDTTGLKKTTIDTPNQQSERNIRRRKHREILRNVKIKTEKCAKPEDQTLLIHGLSNEINQKHLYKKLRKFGKVESIEIKNINQNQIIGNALFNTRAECQKALDKLDKHIFKGCSLRCEILSNVAKKSLRLIIRNLAFQVVEYDLFKAFSQYGEILETKIIRTNISKQINETDNVNNNQEASCNAEQKQKSKGFGFVEFCKQEDGVNAMNNLNGKRIKGRKIFVDVAVPKEQYVAIAQNIRVENTIKEEDSQEKPIHVKNTDKNSNIDDSIDIKVSDPEKTEENFSDKNETESEAYSEYSDDGDDKIEEKDDGSDNDSDNDSDDDDDDVDENEKNDEKKNEYEDEDELDECDNTDFMIKNQKSNRSKPKDKEINIKSTIFIRNVAFHTTEEALKLRFSEFGDIIYVKICYDKISSLSKGSAFIRFKLSESAERAVRASLMANELPIGTNNSSLLTDDGIIVDGRVLQVSQCLPRDEAERLVSENLKKNNKSKDKRNIYLSNEGNVDLNRKLENDDMTFCLPKSDIEKRKRALKEKKEKLKNPLFFVSPIRLSVRNLALHVDDKKLKELFQIAAVKGLEENLVSIDDLKSEYRPPKENIPIKIKMIKVIRDLETEKPGKEAKSRGYGFVEFTQHMHAMAALRHLNNNPNYTSYCPGSNKNKTLVNHLKPRLIIEFALENHAKLKLRQKKLEIAQKKRIESINTNEEKLSTTQKKRKIMGRGARQRERKKKKNESDKNETNTNNTNTKSNKKRNILVKNDSTKKKIKKNV